MAEEHDANIHGAVRAFLKLCLIVRVLGIPRHKVGRCQNANVWKLAKVVNGIAEKYLGSRIHIF